LTLQGRHAYLFFAPSSSGFRPALPHPAKNETPAYLYTEMFAELNRSGQNWRGWEE
jgi:hypothetical protein